MKLRKTVIYTSIAAALGFMQYAHAQDTTNSAVADDDDSMVLEEVIVSGIRGSLHRSLVAKRDSESHVEVISAEDIGKMPDMNIADSLQRVPGVTISAASANEGAFDENDRVSMRGTSASYTQTLVNGHNIASGDWFVLNQTGTVGRSVSYSLLPTEMVQQIIVQKTYEAKLVEGGLTGSVNIKTHRPLTFDSGLTFNGKVGLVYADLPGKTDPQVSGLINWKNDDATFGIMVQAFGHKRHLRRDGQEILGYDVMSPDDAAAVAYPELAGVLYPHLMGSALFEQERKRTGGQVTMEFAPSDDVTIVIDGFTSTMKASNYNRNYMLWGAATIQRGAVPDPGYVVRDNTLVEANFSDPSKQYGIYDQISRPGDESSAKYITGDIEWNLNDQWTVSGQVGTSKGRGKTPTQDVAEWDLALGTGAGWQLNGVGPADWNLGSLDTSQPGTPLEDVKLDWIFGYQDIDVKDKEDWFQLDSNVELDRGSLYSMDFGVRYAKHTRDLDQVTAQGPGCIDSSGNVVGFDWSQQFFCPVDTRSPFDPANWPQGYDNYPGDFASGGFGGDFPRDIWYYSPEQLTEFNEMTNRDPVSRFFYPGAYGVEEKATAAYTQLNFQGAAWSGNLGLRYVKTKENVTNYVNASAADPDAITTSAFGAYKAVETENTYNDWLPTANIRFELNEDMDLRLAATRTLTRADYSALAGSVSLSPPAVEGGTGTGSGGNPDLKPILSTNLDVSWEWYFADRALLSASVFYMDIDNYVALGRETRSIFTIDEQHPDGEYIDYVLTIPVGSSAKVKGFELAWQQPIGDNWGILANYTYADGDTKDGRPMIGTSKNTYNLGGYFETDHWSARVAYNYRSSFYSGLDRASAFFQDSISSVSASVGYIINDNFTISLDGRNLTNERIDYYAESRERPRSSYVNGRQYYLSLGFSF